MSKTKDTTELKLEHTPGPWETFEDEVVASRTEAHIADVTLYDGMNPTEWQANLRLIAAAPDLLAACYELREALAGAMRVIALKTTPKYVFDQFLSEMAAIGIENGVGVRADAAIAKAEGRS